MYNDIYNNICIYIYIHTQCLNMCNYLKFRCLVAVFCANGSDGGIGQKPMVPANCYWQKPRDLRV